MTKFVPHQLALGERTATKYINVVYVQEAQFVTASKSEEPILTLTLTDGTLHTLRGAEAEEGKRQLDAAERMS